MKWETIHPAPETFDFAQGDRLVEFAVAHQMKVRGHTLTWHQQNPKWLTDVTRTPEQLARILEQHIKTVVGHYRGKVFAWDVVNEAFDEGRDAGKAAFGCALARAFGPISCTGYSHESPVHSRWPLNALPSERYWRFWR